MQIVYPPPSILVVGLIICKLSVSHTIKLHVTPLFDCAFGSGQWHPFPLMGQYHVPGEFVDSEEYIFDPEDYFPAPVAIVEFCSTKRFRRCVNERQYERQHVDGCHGVDLDIRSCCRYCIS